MQWRKCRIWIALALWATAIQAMEPPDPGMLERYKKDGSLPERQAFAESIGNDHAGNGLPEKSDFLLKSLAASKGLISPQAVPVLPPGRKGMPTTGSVRVFVVAIDFSDYPHDENLDSIAQMRARIFGGGDDKVSKPYESYRNFYRRSSYNQLELGGEVLGWYRPPYTRASMPQTSAAREKLIADAVNYYASDAGGNHDFSQYDNNKDGSIDFFAVIWSGPDNGWGNFWWGYQTSFGSSVTVDGKRLGSYSWQWEARPLGQAFSPKTLIHETGHGLGLPDLYDYAPGLGPDGGVGDMDIMDWEGDHNPYSKWLLDWITPTLVDPSTDPSGIVLRDQATYKDAVLAMPGYDGKSPFSEFFMVQNRQETGNDLNRLIRGSGVLIWHIDGTLNSSGNSFRYDNSYTSHKLVRLMEADGLEQIENTTGVADPADFYKHGGELGPTTTPDTSRYDFSWTNFGVRNFSPSRTTMTMDFFTTPPDTTMPSGCPTSPMAKVNKDQIKYTWTIGSVTTVSGFLAGYQLQVGSTPGGSDVYDGRFGSRTTSATVRNLYIWDGLPLYARVRAIGPSGLFSEWSAAADPVTLNLPLYETLGDLDAPKLVFKSVGSTPPWQSDTSEYKVGTSSAVAGCLDNEQTYIQTRTAGPGVVSFWWQASTEKNYDYYSIQRDGKDLTRVSGDVAWNKVFVSVPPGSHALTWIWKKDGNTGGTRDLVWLDGVNQENIDLNGDGSPADVLDLAQIAHSFGTKAGDAAWLAAADINQDGTVDDQDVALVLDAGGLR